MSYFSRSGRSIAPALVLFAASAFSVGCSDDTVPVVPDPVTPAPASGADAAPRTDPAVDPLQNSMYSADPSLPPGRKE